jgi:hypothetical protein
VYAALLQDGRLAKGFAANIDPDKPVRPGLLDYDRVAREVHKLTQQVVWLHRTTAGEGGQKIPMPPDPVYPNEEFREVIEADDDAQFWADLTATNPNLQGVPKWN